MYKRIRVSTGVIRPLRATQTHKQGEREDATTSDNPNNPNKATRTFGRRRRELIVAAVAVEAARQAGQVGKLVRVDGMAACMQRAG